MKKKFTEADFSTPGTYRITWDKPNKEDAFPFRVKVREDGGGMWCTDEGKEVMDTVKGTGCGGPEFLLGYATMPGCAVTRIE